MDCTPDTSRQEQLSIMIRTVNMYENDEFCVPKIKEYFLDFIIVESTTGLSLANVVLGKLNEYGMQISNCRGQSYDNGANMTGQYQGVQSRILQLNSRAFFMPCASHNLNLLFRDIAKSSAKAITFFGTIERIYTIFSASTSRWAILNKHCQIMTVKKWSETRWESRLESVKAIRYQMPEILNAFEEISNTSSDSLIRSECKSLENEIGSYEFILSIIIWYDILVEVNTISKSLQSPNMDLDILASMLSGLLSFLNNYRNTGFKSAKTTAKDLAEAIGVSTDFKKTRIRTKKKIFSYEAQDEPSKNEETIFYQDYFLTIVDQAIVSMNMRFSQLESFNNNFGFLYRINKIKFMEKEELRKCCHDLQNVLTDGELKDIDGYELYEELLIFCTMISEEITAFQALTVLKKCCGSFPNISIALRIILSIPVTSAGAERSFSKLKIIKNYLRSTLSQCKLTSLATLSIEQEICDSLDFNELIEIFAAAKARKKQF